MTITLFQQDIEWQDPEANYAKIAEQLAHTHTDLFVLPEMCNTGFNTMRNPLVEPARDVEQRLLQWAEQFHTALCGSFAVSDGVRNYNRCYFVTPAHEVYIYDKHHVFAIGGEHHAFTPGQQRVVVSYQGVRFLLTVCYDLRFPLWLRNTQEESYDVLLTVANWPEKRRLAWDTLLAARAIENQVYAVGVNRIGHDAFCQYDGGTSVYHPYGHALASVPAHTEGLVSFSPDMQKLGDFRTKFPSLRDADSFLLNR